MNDTEEPNSPIAMELSSTSEETPKITPEENPSDIGNPSSPSGFKKPMSMIGPRCGAAHKLRAASRVAPASSDDKTEEEPAEKPLETRSKEEDETQEKEFPPDAKRDKHIPLSYNEPPWGGVPESAYKLEVLKSGVILETIDLSEKSFHVFGRLPSCDVTLAHPTISRHHAILQYRAVADDAAAKGLYLYDLGSTHGTFWNGSRIRPNVYARVRGGHMIRFGCSQRKFIVQTPPGDEEEESELSVSELKERRRSELEERERQERERLLREAEEERSRKEREDNEGIDWGMGEDADEESDLTENPYALTNNEELFLDDPKKTLRGWFEREGCELQYQTEEKGVGQFLCWVELPIDDTVGKLTRAEALVKGKKKEAVIQCALEACRILDRHGLLRQANHEGRKRKVRNWEEEDYYDSDDDSFLDRTGAVEKKREQRMRTAGKIAEQVETYDSLVKKHSEILGQIARMDGRLRRAQNERDASTDNANEEDALDAFMSNLKSSALSKSDITRMRLELQNLRKEEERLRALVDIARPANLPSLTPETRQKNEAIARGRKSRAPQPKNATVTSNASKSDEGKTRENSDDGKADSSARDEELAARLTAGDEADPEAKNRDKEISEKKRKQYLKKAQRRMEKSQLGIPKDYEQDGFREDYSMWLPPQDQSGDGKTDLNDKYGY